MAVGNRIGGGTSSVRGDRGNEADDDGVGGDGDVPILPTSPLMDVMRLAVDTAAKSRHVLRSSGWSSVDDRPLGDDFLSTICPPNIGL